MSFKEKTLFITGASRGIGKAIALKFASSGANIACITKENSDADIKQVTDELEAFGGQVLMFNADVSDAQILHEAILKTIDIFGGIDFLINNTSATCFTDSLHTSSEKFDLMISTSVRAAFFTSQAALPYLKKASNPHIINISPPLNLSSKWFKDYLAFSLSKYAMSLCTLGMAEEFLSLGIAVNSLWPQSTIATQTIQDHFVSKVYENSRWPSIMADAAYALVQRPSRSCTGNFFTDETLLREAGVEDFSQYAVDPSAPLMQALFVENDLTPISQELFYEKHTS